MSLAPARGSLHLCQRGGGGGGGHINRGHGPDVTEGRLANALLTSSLKSNDLPAEAHDVWAFSKAWNVALTTRNTMKPSTTAGMAVLAQLAKVEGPLCLLVSQDPIE
ncbi:uncharacterized protein GLRG_06661 [Colletotrichum graminicola M1.001]|uniref:Uncharacterized protein n=1 Tax=Colletotrichum graminicola (strain M1.001 / M2 / FGSC 10212) TaxID=645133 RepID=E3QLE8_COLGM|nr:uncharacterized protein GLRG_06661 [Colletotrichum graminicola M1.001]EFQ31686.1 hypothetical protein GLRG_06661 [Colletotrichum graminicola M1.001]